MSNSLKVDVWSDLACPWCYIGKRRFAEAVETFSADGRGVEIEYHSFELSPDTPVDFDGNEVDFLVAHKGMAAEQVEQMLAQVSSIAASVGLAFDFDAMQHTNTVKAHQALHQAKAHGLQAELKERLLHAYFEEGRHIGRVDDLADLAAEVGLDREAVRGSLEEDALLPAVRADQAQAQAYGINGVPFFVLEGKYGVSGAQEPAVFVQALTQAWDDRAEADA